MQTIKNIWLSAWAFVGMGVAVLSILAGVLLFLIFLYGFLRSGNWPHSSMAELVHAAGINLYEWVGLYKILDKIPTWLGIPIVGGFLGAMVHTKATESLKEV